MGRCWREAAIERPEFSEIVHDLDRCLDELVIYFDPSNPDRREDPYVNWKQCIEATQGEDEDDDPQVHSQFPRYINDGMATVDGITGRPSQGIQRQSSLRHSYCPMSASHAGDCCDKPASTSVSRSTSVPDLTLV